MRITMTEEEQTAPFVHLANRFAGDIVRAGVAFSKACYQHSKLSLREFEGARARTAEINGCRVCQSWRSDRDLPGYFAAFGGELTESVAARGPAPDEAFYNAVSEWRTSNLFSEREALAIGFAEAMGLDPHGLAIDEEFWARMHAAFTDEEIVDLTYCTAGWMGLGRATHVLGMDDTCSIDTMSKAA